jgi:3-methyladenine DNA glycosylase Tag
VKSTATENYQQELPAFIIWNPAEIIRHQQKIAAIFNISRIKVP